MGLDQLQGIMQISVIVPVYKVEQYLNRCVDSILNQTFTDFELILVDDGSPDNCGRICDEYAATNKRIKVIHQKNQGVSVARNVGIEYALTTCSEWIAFIDSDDWVHPQYLEILYNTATKNKVNIVSCSFYYSVSNQEDNYELFEINKIKAVKGTTEFLFVKKYMNTYAPWGRLYRKSSFSAIRFPAGQRFEDMRTIYKVLYNNGKIAYIQNKLYYYFYNENGASFSKYTVEQAIDEVKAHEEHLLFLYNNQYFRATKIKYDGYRGLVEKLLTAYQSEKVKPVYQHFCDITAKFLKNKKYVKILKKFERKSQINALKSDVILIKNEKNIFFAILYYLKHIFKIYF